MRSRDPLPSRNRAPQATNNASMSAQGMSQRVGSLNTAVRVLRCLLFTKGMVLTCGDKSRGVKVSEACVARRRLPSKDELTKCDRLHKAFF